MKKFVMLFLPIAGVLILQLLLLDWAARSSGQPLRETLTPLSVSVAVLILVTGVLPALVRPQPVHTLIACFATLFGLFLVVPFDVSDMPALHSGVPTYRFLGPYLLLRLVNAAILLPLAVHVSARFPRPTSVSPKMLSGGYILSLFLLAAFLLSSTFWQRILSTGLSFLWFTIVIGFFVWNLLVVARDPRPEGAHDAQQARIVMFSVLIAEIPLWLRPLTLALGLDIFPYNLLLVFQLVIPIGIAYAVLQHDLFGIDRVLRRTLAYGAVSLALLMLYLGFATALTGLFANLTSQSRPIVTVIGLLLAALLFEPARRFTQKWLDKLLYPDRLKFQLAVRSVQASLAQANRRDEIIQLLDEDFPAQIGAEWGALKLFPEPDVPPVHDGPPAWNTRLTAGNVSFGGYWLGPRHAGPAYDSDERNRLQALTQQAALALAYANAYESLYELNQNLERRVKEQTARTLEDQKEITAYQERQCIARELHDSVTQKIFGMHLMARGLNAAIPGSLPKIKGEMTELETQARQVLREMRLLLNQLRNASSGEKVNLTEAIQSQCEALGGQSGPEGGPLLSVRLDAPEDIVLPSAFAEEALWVVREALQNILRHSGSRTAECCLRAGDRLRVTIKDDGCGFDAQKIPDGHFGLRGMRERVLSLGGEFKVESEIGRGTVLSFSLPLPLVVDEQR